MTNPPHPCTDPNYVGIGLDWIGSTVVGEAAEVVATLAKATGLEPRTTHAGKGYGYRSCVGLYGGDDAIAKVHHSPNRDPFVVAEGQNSDRVYAILANRFPNRCTAARKDIAVDFGDPDFYDVLYVNAVEIAVRRGIEVNLMGDWPVPGSPKGRTAYFGSRQSIAYVRLYEFRKYHGYGPHVRLELEFKPKTEDKRWLFGASHREVLGRSPLVTELLARVGVDIERTVARLVAKAPTDLDHAVNSLVAQYGKLLRDRLLPALENDASQVGPHLLQRLAALEADRAKISQAAAVHFGPTTLIEAVSVGYSPSQKRVD